VTEDTPFPSNVLDYGSRILGMSYERVVMVVLTVCISSVLMEISYFAAILFTVMVFPLVLISRDDTPLYSAVLRAVVYHTAPKRAEIHTHYSRITSRNCIIAFHGRLLSITGIAQRSILRLGDSERASAITLMEKTFNSMGTDAIFLSIPVDSSRVPLPAFSGGGNINQLEDYENLVAHACRGSFYQSAYVILTGHEVNQTTLENETAGVRRYLESYGFACRDPGEEETLECLSFLE
jgi:hypothetical protein